MGKQATKQPAKKATKRATRNRPKNAPRATSPRLDERSRVARKLQSLHRAVLSLVDKVHADDVESIARLKRAVEHAHDNARARKG